MNIFVNDWIDDHVDEFIQDVKKLCRVESVNGEPCGDMPFGEGAYKALKMAAFLADSYGFHVKNYNNYVCTADFDTNLPPCLDILGHVDVVPGGSGWTVTDPFHVIEKDGYLYGRGVSDDKGPLLAALYALRAVKEMGVELDGNVRVIIGSDEETGSLDIKHYYAEESPAPFTFSPDAEFPVINIEKGQFRGCLKKNFNKNESVPRVISLEAGVAVNAVPERAVIRFEGLSEYVAEPFMKKIEKICGVKMSYDVTGKTTLTDEAASICEITVIGKAAHASIPEDGINAGLAALMFVQMLPLASCEMADISRKVIELFPYGVTDGSGLGIKMGDSDSHELTCTLDIYHMDEEHAEFYFDARTPVSANKENCEDIAGEAIKSAGFIWETQGMIPPHVVSKDSEFVRKLLSAYEDVTGEGGRCIAIGGGTYVHDIENGVAFGAVMPETDTHMHGADECMEVANLVKAAKIYAEAIISIAGKL